MKNPAQKSAPETGPALAPAYIPTVPNMLRHARDAYHDQTWLIRGDERVSYHEAEQRSSRLALALIKAGIGKGSRVAVVLPDGPDWVISWLACSRIGAVFVPLSTMSTARELGWLIQHSDAALLIVARDFLRHDYALKLQEIFPGFTEGSQQYLAQAPYLRRIVMLGSDVPTWATPLQSFLNAVISTPALNALYLENMETQVTPGDVATIIYTSGTTADPKGVVHSQGAMVRHSYALHLLEGRSPGEKALNAIPLFWVGGFVFQMMKSLHAGCAIVTPESRDLARIIALIKEERISILDGWMDGFDKMRQHPDFNEADFDFVKPALAPFGFRAPLGHDGVPVPLNRLPNSLGQSETLGPHTKAREGTLLEGHQVGSFGFGIPGLQHMIVDPDTGAECERGKPGEIFIRGYAVMLGYYKKEREECFTVDGFHRSGDSGHFDADGHLYFLGRRGEMIKTIGTNVSPREVESVIAQLPYVAEVAVVGLPDEQLGEIVAAAIVLKEDAQVLDVPALHAYLKRELSHYKIPRRYAVVRADEMPRTSGGKIKKSQLIAGLDFSGLIEA
ncbi:MAG TPA: class I adenylate-forming enzyme family protein [Pseudomonas sp.]|nr:class I adenylate-forming enzyme family protein [Pseudomonas sp.]